MLRHTLVKFGLAWFILCVSVFGQTLKYTLTDLGTFGGTLSVAGAINNSGTVVGYFNLNGRSNCFYWTNSVFGKVTWSSPNSSGNCNASGINDHGEIAGTSTLTNGYQSAFRATVTFRNGRNSVNNNYLSSPYGKSTYAAGIDLNGNIVGTVDTVGSQAAVVFNHIGDYFEYEGGPTVGTAIGGQWPFFTMFVGFNNQPAEAGIGYYSNSQQWEELGLLSSQISNVNASDSFGDFPVGYAVISDGTKHAVQWTYDGEFFRVLDLSAGANSWANSTSDDQWIVGQFSNGSRPFLAIPRTCVYPVDLEVLLDTSGAGWNVMRAYGINNNHQIVGAGIFGGVTHAILLTPNTGSLCM